MCVCVYICICIYEHKFIMAEIMRMRMFKMLLMGRKFFFAQIFFCPLFWDGNLKFGRCHSGDILYIGELAKFQIQATPGSKVTGLRTFGPKNGPVPKNHYATPLTRILLGAFVAVGDPTKS